MTKIVSPEWLLRHAVGYDALANLQALGATANYPPHNIEKIDEDHYRLTLAVAGFQRDEITLSIHKGFLTVTGQKADEDEGAAPSKQYLYRGIAFRDFERQFKLGDHVNVSGAYMEHGLLVIELQRDVPEAEKPKFIAIT